MNIQRGRDGGGGGGGGCAWMLFHRPDETVYIP